MHQRRGKGVGSWVARWVRNPGGGNSAGSRTVGHSLSKPAGREKDARNPRRRWVVFSDSPCSSTSGRHPCLVRFAAAGMRPWNGLGSWPPFLTILEFCGRCGCHDGTPFTRVNRKLDMISSNSTYLPTGLLLSHRPCLLLKKNVPEPCRQRPLLGQHLTCPVGQRRLQALLGHHNITYPCTHLPSRQGYMGRDFVSTLTIASENAHLSQTAAIRADVCLNPCRNRDGHRNSFSHQHVQLHEQFTNVQLICI